MSGVRISLLFVALVSANDVSINGDLQVLGALSVAHIESSSLTVNGSIAVTDEVKTQLLTATSAKIGVLQTDTLYSPSGNLHLAGGLLRRRRLHAPAALHAADVLSCAGDPTRRRRGTNAGRPTPSDSRTA